MEFLHSAWTKKNKKGFASVVNNKIKNLGLGLIFITVIAKLIGFFRLTVFAGVYGVGIEADLYFLAYTIPFVIFFAISNAIETSLVPIITRYLVDKGERETNKFLTKFIVRLALLILIYSVIWLSVDSYFITIYAPGINNEQAHILGNYLLILLPCIFNMLVLGVFKAYLQVKKCFYPVSTFVIPLNLSIIMGIILSNGKNMEHVVYFTLIGSLLQLLYLNYFVFRQGFRLELSSDKTNEGFTEFRSIFMPIIVGVGIKEINTLVDRVIASTLGEGSVSSLTYSLRIINLFYGILVAPYIMRFYANITKNSTEGDSENYAKSIRNAFSFFALIIPVMFIVFLLSDEIVQIVYGYGVFTEDGIIRTSSALKLYSIGLITYFIRDIFIRLYYSRGNSRIPMRVNVSCIFINLILNVILTQKIGYLGLPLATSISAIIGTSLLAVVFTRENQENRLFKVGDIACIVLPIIVQIALYFALKNFFVSMNIITMTMSLTFLLLAAYFVSHLLCKKVYGYANE